MESQNNASVFTQDSKMAMFFFTHWALLPTCFLCPSHTSLLGDSSPKSYQLWCATCYRPIYTPSLLLCLPFLLPFPLPLPPSIFLVLILASSLTQFFSHIISSSFLSFLTCSLLSFLSLSLYSLGCAITSHLYIEQIPTSSLRSNLAVLSFCSLCLT